MSKKFELTDETVTTWDDRVLRRIRALREIVACGVAVGQLGGYVESERNLDHSGNAWVSGNARVSGNAWVSGNARVSGNAWVYGDAQVYGNARVSGNAWVYGDAQVYGNARVYGNAQVYGDARVGPVIRDVDLSTVPVVAELDRKIDLATREESALDMTDWHACDTTHCRAGWAIHLAGQAGYDLEARVGSWLAGALIYVASTGREEVPDFLASDRDAREDIERRAKAVTP